MPLDALANDNWGGRERPHVRAGSKATKMLASIGRCCWKQVRLGKGAPDVQQKGINGNTILFAQPTANISFMELPPPTDALVDTMNIAFARNTHDLSRAYWATVKRSEYMQIVQERKQQCATFAEVSVREDLAATRLPEDGVPEHVQVCMQAVEGVDKAPVRLFGPASRAPELGREEEAGEESEGNPTEESDKGEHQPGDPDVEYTHENVAEITVAVDPVHEVGPVAMIQALKGTLGAIQRQATSIAKNEKTPRVADSSGTLQTVGDEGGRHVLKSMVLDVQAAARSLDERSQAELEKAQTGADACRIVDPQSLAVPTQGPMSSFDSRSWPACFVEFWFGDCAPNLQRDRPMLFEQVFVISTVSPLYNSVVVWAGFAGGYLYWSVLAQLVVASCMRWLGVSSTWRSSSITWRPTRSSTRLLAAV